MGNLVDLTGQVFGLLTVLERDIEAQKNNNSKRAHWKCQCKCGNIVSRSSNALKMAKVPSCGCYNNQVEAHIIDITNQKFGKLTVISRNDEYRKQMKMSSKSRDSYWNCICDCGRTCIRSKSSLNESSKCNFCCHKGELIGKRKFMLTLLYPTEYKHGKYTVWHCKCDCGNEIELDTNELSWKTSCGCVQHKSKGEIEIENILKANNIKYIYNKGYFHDLVYKSNRHGRYDFILLNEKDEPYRLIEFDGKQHFDEASYCFFYKDNNEITYEECCKKDLIKNEYAKNHNLPLVRIPYTVLHKITLDMILGDQFLI